jgi:hypothetical protein
MVLPPGTGKVEHGLLSDELMERRSRPALDYPKVRKYTFWCVIVAE